MLAMAIPKLVWLFFGALPIAFALFARFCFFDWLAMASEMLVCRSVGLSACSWWVG